MKLSRLFLLLALLIFFSSTPRSCHAIGRSFSAPSTFRSPFSSSPFAERAQEFESQKRRVPTGSNPLHNKRNMRDSEHDGKGRLASPLSS
ncbi:hypothetical protein SADUNF_Sadunf14G0118800 [Salix dunnii]|uniref:Uncharacterized protein n=1 Tax=Salix dunnii TaxID=1413687 RepID=A0A835MK61_9ROSI|nr:hypothetical protein SADUNF_Sadunf14G0118800 [Salix dunnii]